MAGIYADRDEYAVSTWTGGDYPLKETLQMIHESGFHFVELWGDTVHFDPRAQINRCLVKKWLKQYGMTVHSVHAPFRRFSQKFPDASDFLNFRMRLLKQTIDDCGEFEVPYVVMHGLDRWEYNYTEAQAPLVHDQLEELCAYAERRGVLVALENLFPKYPVPDKDEMDCSLKAHAAHFGDISLLRFCLDIGHARITPGVTFEEEITAVGNRLVTTHIHNNDGIHDCHSLPTQGVIDWPALHKYLRSHGYNNQFVLEVEGGKNAPEIIKKLGGLFD